MKILAFNGSPRKNWNTSTLLDKALEGAQSQGAEVEQVNLYDLNYKGCISCFACKRKGKIVEQCTVKDDLFSILQKVCECDAIVLGSPIYLGSMTGEMQSFFERLIFPYDSYDRQPSLFKKKIKTAFIYTMNCPRPFVRLMGYANVIKKNKHYLKKMFGSSEALLVTETCQFDDYSKYAASRFDGAKRVKRQEAVFKNDCRKAFELGKRLVS